MKFEFKNLGYLEQATIELADLTIICGKNNTGKTYVNYAIYGFLSTWYSNIELAIDDEIETLLKDGILKINLSEYKQAFIDAIEQVCKSFSGFLSGIFNVEEDYFLDLSFKVNLDNYKPDQSSFIKTEFSPSLNSKQVLRVFKKKNSKEIEFTLFFENQKLTLSKNFIEAIVNYGLLTALSHNYFIDSFIITSERTGVSLFYKELDINKNIVIEKLRSQQNNFKFSDLNEILNDSLSRYSLPIKNEIDFVRDLNEIKKEIGELTKQYPDILSIFEDIVGGKYNVENDAIFFDFNIESQGTSIPFHAASSTVKSLIGLNFYLKHKAKPGDLLIIDEPELNLHPANQRKLAKLFSRLIKCGIKLLMTTHSDYLIKELNNLIVLNNDLESKEELMAKYKYTEDDILDKDRVRVYIAENHTLIPAKITDIGIEVGAFDDEIIEMNNFFDEATIGLDAAYDL